MRGVEGLLDAPPRGALDRDRADGVSLARLARAVSAARVLSGALWEALCEQLEQACESDGVAGPSGVSAERVSEVSERLADVAATVGLLAQRRLAFTAPPRRAPLTSAQSTVPRTDQPADDTPPSVPVLTPGRPPPWQARPDAERSASDGRFAGSPQSPVEEPASEIEDRHRADAVHPALEHALAQLEPDQLPCAVMLVELAPAERDGRGPAGTAPSPLGGQIEDAFVRTLQSIAVGLDGQLMRERPGRHLLLLPETDRLRAQKLIGRLVGVAHDAGAAGDCCATAQAGRDAPTIADGDAGAVAKGDAAVAGGEAEAAADGNDRAERYFAALSARTSARHAARPAPPLELAVGLAVCPQDGREASALLGHASQDLFSRTHAVSVQAGTVT
jgi:hypothetical protein